MTMCLYPFIFRGVKSMQSQCIIMRMQTYASSNVHLPKIPNTHRNEANANVSEHGCEKKKKKSRNKIKISNTK